MADSVEALIATVVITFLIAAYLLWTFINHDGIDGGNHGL